MGAFSLYNKFLAALLSPHLGHSRQAKVFYFCKYLVFRLKAFYNLAQWKRPERTTPWVRKNKISCALKGHNKNIMHIFSTFYAALSGR
jgi:hypothetical protein